MSVVLELALGGEDPAWLHLPGMGDRARWCRLVDPAAEVVLLELVAAAGERLLLCPSEVPWGGPTTLAAILADVDAELGAGARIEELRLRLPAAAGAAAVVLSAHGERELRLEAGDDRSFAPWLARLTALPEAVPEAVWQAVLVRLRAEQLTGEPLRLVLDPGAGQLTVEARGEERYFFRL